MFSKTCEYAIRATLFIALKSVDESKVSIDAICENIEAPKPFTAKILQTLVNSNVVSSKKGVKGGFYITEEQLKASLITIVYSVDGKDIFTKCAIGLKHCAESHPCPIHSKFKVVREKLTTILTKATIGNMAKKVDKGVSFLKV